MTSNMNTTEFIRIYFLKLGIVHIRLFGTLEQSSLTCKSVFHRHLYKRVSNAVGLREMAVSGRKGG